MTFADLIVVVILVVVVGSAILYIRKERKKGVRCIGCPQAGSCPKNGCHTEVPPEFRIKDKK